MAIVHMFGFDQMPVMSNLSPARMELEGFGIFDVGSSNHVNWQTWKRGGRTRLMALTATYNSSYQTSRSTQLTGDVPLSTWFGDRTKLTQGIIGVRVYVNDKWKSFRVSNGHVIRLGGSWQSPTVLEKLDAGEYYFEYVFDFVKQRLQLYIDGILHIEIDANLSMATTFGIGQTSTTYGYNSGCIIDYSDIYSVWDTEDDSPCDRLGPVQIKWLPVEEVAIPADWSVSREAMHGYMVDGVYSAYDGLIPRYLEADSKERCVTLTANSNAGSMYVLADAANPSHCQWSNVLATTVTLMTAQFPKAKRVSAYALNGATSATYGFMEDWAFQGSNDGVTWTVLDSKTGQAAAHSTGIPVVHRLATDKIGLYTHYRLRGTKQKPGGSTSLHVSVTHFQLLAPVTDRAINDDQLSLINMPYNANLADTAVPALRTSVNESEASFRFAKPVVGTADIKMVQLRLAGKRDPGTEEYLITRSALGGAASADKNLRLDTDFRWGPVLENLTVNHDGQPWTADTVGQLKLIVKSKTGEV